MLLLELSGATIGTAADFAGGINTSPLSPGESERLIKELNVGWAGTFGRVGE